MGTDSRWLQRGIKEAYYIAALDPDLNQDRGRHTVSPVYKTSTTASSNHVTAGYPVVHMTRFLPLHSLSDEVPWMWDEI